MTISPSELYTINFQNPEPKYYTRMPNIISDLTYDFIDPKTGETIVKKLSIYAKELYRVIRMFAGDCGRCWQSRDNLAELCGMSAGKITDCKEELEQSFHQLDGNPLIKITTKKKSIMKENIQTGKTDYHEITIINIWPWNNGYMATKKYLKDKATSPNDGVPLAPSPNDTAPEEALSPHDTNKNSNNKTSLSLEQQLMADANSAFFVSSISLDKEILFDDPKKQRAYEWLSKEGCNNANAKSIANKFTGQDISEASKYLDKMLIKKRQKREVLTEEQKWKYFQDILNKRYWEKK